MTATFIPSKLLLYLQNSSNPDVIAIKELLALHTLGLVDFSLSFDLLIQDDLTNQIDGVVDTLTTSQQIGGKLEVYLNGLLQSDSDDFYQISSNQIQFIQPLEIGDKVKAVYIL